MNIKSILGLRKKVFYKKPSSRLLFYHVPKAAGSSLVEMLGDAYRNPYKPTVVSHYRSFAGGTRLTAEISGVSMPKVREIDMLIALANKRNMLITGHFDFCVSAREHFPDVAYITLLREPVRRFLSHYFYNRYKPEKHFSTELSLDEYIEKGPVRMYVDRFGYDKSGLISDLNERYAAAINNIRSLDVVGVVERMPEFISALEDKLGVVMEPLPVARENPRAGYMSEVTPDQLRRIEEACSDDIRLYNEICQFCS